jgi:hypothetical protein
MIYFKWEKPRHVIAQGRVKRSVVLLRDYRQQNAQKIMLDLSSYLFSDNLINIGLIV